MTEPDFVSARHVTGFDQACHTHRRGHVPHWIQLGVARREDTYRPADVLGVDGHWITFVSDGEIHRMWHHDTANIDLALRRLHQDAPELTVEYSRRCGLLLVSSLNLEENAERGPERTAVPLCVAEEPSECDSTPTWSVAKHR